MGWLQKFTSLFVGNKDNAKKKKLGSILDFSSFTGLSDYFGKVNMKKLKESNALYCNCADTVVKAFSTVEFDLYYKGKPVDKGDLDFRELLTLTPNPVMTFSQLLSAFAHDLTYYRLGLLFIERDKDGTPKALWNVPPSSVEVSYVGRDIWLSFDNPDVVRASYKHRLTVPLSDVIYESYDSTSEEPFNMYDEYIRRPLEVIEADYTGFEDSVKRAHIIRYILTKPGIDDDNDTIRGEFDRQVAQDKSGLIVLDHAETLTQVNQNPVYAKAPEMENFEQACYSLFHVNKGIVQNNMTPDQKHQFIEGTIKPLIKPLMEQFNRKLLTKIERAHGNEIRTVLEPIKNASFDTKKQTANLIVSMGYYRPNDIYRLLDLPLLPDDIGEKVVQSLSFGIAGQNNKAKETNEQDDKSKEGETIQAEKEVIKDQQKEEGENENDE